MFLSNGPLRIRERLISRPLERPSFPSLARSADQLHLLPLLLRDIHYRTYRSIDPSIASFECWPLPRRKCKIQSSPHRHFYTGPSHIIFLSPPPPFFCAFPSNENWYPPTGVMYLCRNMCIHENHSLLPHPSHLTRVEQDMENYAEGIFGIFPRVIIRKSEDEVCERFEATRRGRGGPVESLKAEGKSKSVNGWRYWMFMGINGCLLPRCKIDRWTASTAAPPMQRAGVCTSCPGKFSCELQRRKAAGLRNRGIHYTFRQILCRCMACTV